MDDEEALIDLQKEYDFEFEISSSLALSITRVIARSGPPIVEGVERLSSQKSFYFEVRHAPAKLPVVHFLFGSHIPEEIEAYLQRSRTTFLNRLRMAFGLDPLCQTLNFPWPVEASPSTVEQIRAVLSIAQGAGRNSGLRMHLREASSESGTVHDDIARKKRFTIKSIEREIEEVRIEDLAFDDLIMISSRCENMQAESIVFSEVAWKSIADHVAFGLQTRDNIFEQGGVYVGTPCVCPQGRRVGVAKGAISAPRTNGTGTYVEFTHEMWRHFMDVLELRRETGEYGRADVILGWYHTHPNGLDVFMSGTDMGTQAEQFYRPWNSAVVINPHRKLVAGFYGMQASPANVFLKRGLQLLGRNSATDVGLIA